MSAEKHPTYYTITPAKVRYDSALKPAEKLFYGELVTLAQSSGYCTASNPYFAKLYSVSTITVSRWVNALKKAGYIDVEMIVENNKIQQRKIAITGKGGINKNVKGVLTKMLRGINKNVKGGINKNVKGGINKNVKENNTSNRIIQDIIAPSPSFFSFPARIGGSKKNKNEIETFNVDDVLLEEIKTTITDDERLIKTEFLKMEKWIESKPNSQKKTISGMPRFIINWLDRAVKDQQQRSKKNADNNSTRQYKELDANFEEYVKRNGFS